MTLDRSIIPDPAEPHPLDAYGSTAGRHELVVARTRFIADEHSQESSWVVRYFLRGVLGDVPKNDFAALVASFELRPTGRMTTQEQT